MSEFVRYERGIPSESVSRDEQVHRADCHSFGLQLLANPSVVRGARNGVVVVEIERSQKLADRGDFAFVLAAVTCSELQFRNGHRRQSYRITACLGSAATLDQFLRSLPLRRSPCRLQPAHD